MAKLYEFKRPEPGNEARPPRTTAVCVFTDNSAEEFDSLTDWSVGEDEFLYLYVTPSSGVKKNASCIVNLHETKFVLFVPESPSEEETQVPQ